jgi:hypothetical protein
MSGVENDLTPETLRLAVFGLNFHEGLDRLEAAYGAACARPSELIADAQRRARALTETWRCHDDLDLDDREALADHADGLGDQMSVGIASLGLVREAFVISLSHYWERKIRDFAGGAVCDKDGRFRHDRAIGVCKGLGFRVLAKELTILKYAAEVAKHSLGPSALKLLKLRPGCFVAGTTTANVHYDRLMIVPHHVDIAFLAVRVSGPPQGLLGL